MKAGRAYETSGVYRNRKHPGPGGGGVKAERQDGEVSGMPRLERSALEKLYRRWCGPLFGALALVITLLVLFGGGEIGLSNNGDFARVMRAASLSYGARVPSHTYAGVFVIDLSHNSAPENLKSILFGTAGLRDYPSVHVAAVRLSVVLNLVLNKLMGWEMNTYHIGVLGVMYTVLYAAGIGFLLSQFRLRRVWQDALVKAAALIVLCDVGYVAYFNSFYGEGPEHIALVWCAAMLVRVLTRTPTAWDGIWCAVCAVAYGWAKFFNIPLAILALLVTEGIILVRSGKRRVLAFGGGALVFLMLIWAVVPGWMDIETNYNAVFYGVVRDVDRETAEGYLEDLGLPPELADFRNTNYYLSGLHESLRERGLWDEARSVSKTDLLRFYLTHPGRLWEQANLTALHAGMVRPYYLANYGEGYPLMTYSARMSLWGSLRDWLAFDTLWGAFAVTAAAVAMAVAAWRKQVRPLWLALLLLALLGGLSYAYLLPVMLNGEGDFAKHMFAYVEITDLLLIAVTALALDRTGRGRHGGLLCSAIGLALAAALAVPSLWSAAAGALRDNRSHTHLEPGAFVTLGSYEGKPLIWLVADETGTGFTLLCMNEDISLPFDEGGANDWASSSLREWLNGPFLTGFTAEELALLSTVEHPVILPDHLRDTAECGSLDFACSHIAVLADRLWEQTWQITAEDTVSLPGIDLAARLSREGRDISGRPWWLETPYCPSTTMARYVGKDGHIYFGDTTAARTVRPTVELRRLEPTAGSGSLSDPFALN